MFSWKSLETLSAMLAMKIEYDNNDIVKNKANQNNIDCSNLKRRSLTHSRVYRSRPHAKRRY